MLKRLQDQKTIIHVHVIAQVGINKLTQKLKDLNLLLHSTDCLLPKEGTQKVLLTF